MVIHGHMRVNSAAKLLKINIKSAKMMIKRFVKKPLEDKIKFMEEAQQERIKKEKKRLKKK